ncbi:MAG: hypothetical protein AB7F99_15460 [Vicinamibacterales bacterium]
MYEQHWSLAFTADKGRGPVPVRVAEPGRRRFEAVRLEQFEPMMLEGKTAKVTIHYVVPVQVSDMSVALRQTLGMHILPRGWPGHKQAGDTERRRSWDQVQLASRSCCARWWKRRDVLPRRAD